MDVIQRQGVRRVLCALSKDERRLFLNGAAEGLTALPAQVMWRDELASKGGAALAPEVVLTGWSTGVLPRAWVESEAGGLRYVCHLAGSVRQLVPRSFIERGGLVTNWGEIPARAVAEHALLLALTALRNLPAWPEAVPHLGETVRRIELLGTRSLGGQRVGIHGFGRVARALVRLLAPFEVSVSAYSAGVSAAAISALGVTPCGSLRELVAGSDVLFECEGLTAATAGSVSEEILAAMPDGALFVNVARGQIVDEAALLREVSAGRLRAALDVVATEPVEATRERFRAAGAVLSPHIAGPTLDQYARCGEFALENIARYLRGEPLRAVVTLEDYDRAT